MAISSRSVNNVVRANTVLEAVELLKTTPNGSVRVVGNGEAATPDEWDDWRRKRGITAPGTAVPDDDVIDVKARIDR